MAIAIFNGLNKKENCHLYREKIIEREQKVVDGSTARLHGEILQATGMVGTIQSSLTQLHKQSADQLSALEESTAAIEEMISALAGASTLASGKREQLDKLSQEAQGSEREMSATVGAIRSVSHDISGVSEMISVIYDVADKTNLLAMNAAIQAAHAGNAGRSFSVVAAEIRKLAETTGENAKRIAGSLGAIVDQIGESDRITASAGQSIQTFSGDVAGMAREINALIGSLAEMSAGSTKINQNILNLRELSQGVKELYSEIEKSVGNVLEMIEKIASISDETQRTITSIGR